MYQSVNQHKQETMQMTLKHVVHSHRDTPEGRKQVETKPEMALSIHVVGEHVSVDILRLVPVYHGTNQRSTYAGVFENFSLWWKGDRMYDL